MVEVTGDRLTERTTG